MKIDIEYPYLCKDRDRHGNVRFYFRRKGHKKIPLRAGPEQRSSRPPTMRRKPETDEKAPVSPAVDPRPKPGTLRWLCTRYFSSTDFKQLDPSTQTVRRRVLEHICEEPIAPGIG